MLANSHEIAVVLVIAGMLTMFSYSKLVLLHQESISRKELSKSAKRWYRVVGSSNLLLYLNKLCKLKLKLKGRYLKLDLTG